MQGLESEEATPEHVEYQQLCLETILAACRELPGTYERGLNLGTNNMPLEAIHLDALVQKYAAKTLHNSMVIQL